MAAVPVFPFKILAGVAAAALLLAACSKDKLNIGSAGAPQSQPELRDIDGGGLLRMAQRLEAAGDYANALQFYNEAAEKNPANPEAWLGMGRIFAAGGAPAQAVQAFGAAFDIDPGNSETARRYARGLLAQERAADALAALTRHLAKNKPDAELLNLLGIAEDLMLEPAAAEKAYRDGLALTGPGEQWFDALTGNLALSLAANQRISEAILILNPHVGDMRLGAGGITEAQSQYRQNLALVYALSGNTASAMEVAKSALPGAEAERNRAFYSALPTLTGFDRVRAVFLGKLPPSFTPPPQ